MMNFERGINPKDAMKIGYIEIFESMKGCLLLTEKDLYQTLNHPYFSLETVRITNIRKQKSALYEAFVIIIVIEDKFRIIKNRFSTNKDKIFDIKELPGIVFELKTAYDKWILGDFSWAYLNLDYL
jgi:hypothetical protein